MCIAGHFPANPTPFGECAFNTYLPLEIREKCIVLTLTIAGWRMCERSLK